MAGVTLLKHMQNKQTVEKNVYPFPTPL